MICNFLLLRAFKENVIKMSANSSLKIFLMKDCKVAFGTKLGWDVNNWLIMHKENSLCFYYLVCEHNFSACKSIKAKNKNRIYAV